MSTACAAVAKISEARFLELLQAPGEFRAEEVDAACAKLREQWELNLSSTNAELKLWNQVQLASFKLGCIRCRYSRLGCISCNPIQEERRTKFPKVRAACSKGEEKR